MQIQYTETAHSGKSKVERYKWSDPGKPGVFRMLHKSTLEIPDEYQRALNEVKVAEITRNFSWPSFGVIVVVYRNGIAFVIDGQHRCMATLRREDIDALPCMVFDFDDITEEAKAFLGLNTLRRPLTSIERHKAEALAGDAVSVVVERVLEENGLRIAKTATHAGQIKCIAYCKRLASGDQDLFRRVIKVAAELSLAQQVPVQEVLIKGLGFLDERIEGGICAPRFLKRLQQVGAHDLLLGARRFIHAMANSSQKSIATGMLEVINKGLQKKFQLTE